MFRIAAILCFAVGMLSESIDSALAQNPDLYKAPGVSEGNAGTELSRIRRRDIGTGYSSSQINNQTLNQGALTTPFIGGYTGRTVIGGATSAGISGGSGRSAPSLGVGIGAPVSKPFSGASSGPTISPYMNLFREDFGDASDLNYQTLVRPQLQQQQINSDLQRQQLETNKRVQSLSARQDYNPQGSTTQAPTGHSTTFRYHSHYYPSMGQRRGR